ncbi:hypothetical protein [Parvibaculum sp.]|uniref:hypothetical protein n=1 Tax=Parvibaculum sp. TaxID=2024848 RepID=UPI00320E2C63
MKTNVIVLDALMGSGKTTFITSYMNASYLTQASATFDDPSFSPEPFIYIGVYLDEAQRIKEACPHLEFAEPQPIGGKKLRHLNDLIRDRRNIASTHALFKLINDETFDALKEGNYTLVVDECLECVMPFEDVSPADWKTLFEGGHVYIDGRKRVRWNHKDWPDYKGRFETIRNLCDSGNIVQLDEGVFFWELPAELLSLFKEVYICTYLFEGSPMASYLKAHGVDYKLMSIGRGGALVEPDDVDTGQQKAKLRELITIVQDPGLNSIGAACGRANPLSATWLDREASSLRRTGQSKLEQLKRSLYRYFKYGTKVPVSERMWTSFKDQKRHLKGDGYTKGFVPCNARAMNKYRHKSALAYAVNIFMHPMLKRYFQERGVQPNEDLYALSEMLQWIWRSRIRDGLPITIYVPSERMRRLLERWLRNEAFVVVESNASLAA